MRIIAIGEAMLELSSAGENAGGPDLWRMGVAGDTLNTAWYLRAMLPQPWVVDFVSRLGQDVFSDRIVDFISHNGIGAAHIMRDPVRGAGLYAISLKSGERSFTYWREHSAARLLADDLPALTAALVGAKLAYLSAITLAILSPDGRARLIAALRAARAEGCKIAFDTNYRPRLWENAETARSALQAIFPICDIILPSADDDAALFADRSARDTAARYQQVGIAEGVVKNAGGAVYWWAGRESGLITDLPRHVPIDTTAAGDSFNGGYIAARLQGASPQASVVQAHGLACAVIATFGALLDMQRIKSLNL